MLERLLLITWLYFIKLASSSWRALTLSRDWLCRCFPRVRNKRINSYRTLVSPTSVISTWNHGIKIPRQEERHQGRRRSGTYPRTSTKTSRQDKRGRIPYPSLIRHTTTNPSVNSRGLPIPYPRRESIRSLSETQRVPGHLTESWIHSHWDRLYWRGTSKGAWSQEEDRSSSRTLEKVHSGPNLRRTDFIDRLLWTPDSDSDDHWPSPYRNRTKTWTSFRRRRTNQNRYSPFRICTISPRLRPQYFLYPIETHSTSTSCTYYYGNPIYWTQT